MVIDNILILGSMAYDEIMDFPGQFTDHFHPEKLHQINVSFVVSRLVKQTGGIATNISYNLRQVSSKKITVFGGLGKDGNEFLEFFSQNNIDASSILIDHSLYTATGKVMTDLHNNQIWAFYYGASIHGTEVSLEKYTDANSLLVISATHEKPFIHFQREAVKHSIKYLYDPGMALTWIKPDDLREGIMNAKYLVGNDYEVGHIQKVLHISTEELISQGLVVITTLGEKGVRYQSKDEEYYVPAFLVKDVVDPTGAGDAFRGGFIGGLAEGKDILEALKLGNVLASFAIEKYGTVNHKPTKEEIMERLIELT